MQIDPAKTYTAEMVTSMGSLTIALDPIQAPNTVNSWLGVLRVVLKAAAREFGLDRNRYVDVDAVREKVGVEANVRPARLAAEKSIALVGDKDRLVLRIGEGNHAVVGARRLDFTVIGDAVNLGARLESLNKDYGTRIIISEVTRSRLKGQYDIHPLGDVVVKGKSNPVAIFEVKTP